MIPADHITFNDDGVAWWVMDDPTLPPSSAAGPDMLDRPCATCDGSGYMSRRYINDGCPAGCIDGRHTFEIEVECDEPDVRRYEDQGWHNGPTCIQRQCVKGALALRVSVVPGMVLPIEDTWQSDHPMIFHDPTSPVSEWWHTLATPDGFNMPITLPSAAAPGMWAVELRLDNPDALP